MGRIADCSLRRMEEKDLQIVLQWRNSQRIRESMFTNQVISWEDHFAWFARMNKDPDVEYLMFEYRNCPAGVVNFSCQNRQSKRYLWGFYIGEETLPRGTGSAMGYLGLQYIFDTEGAHKVSGEVLITNQISLHFHEKLGFLKEGYLCKHVIKNNSYFDVVLFSMLYEDWKIKRVEIQRNLFEVRKDV